MQLLRIVTQPIQEEGLGSDRGEDADISVLNKLDICIALMKNGLFCLNHRTLQRQSTSRMTSLSRGNMRFSTVRQTETPSPGLLYVPYLTLPYLLNFFFTTRTDHSGQPIYMTSGSNDEV